MVSPGWARVAVRECFEWTVVSFQKYQKASNESNPRHSSHTCSHCSLHTLTLGQSLLNSLRLSKALSATDTSP